MGQTPAKITPIIDISGSMAEYDYITAAKSDLDTFVNMFQPQDKFAVIAFNSQIHRTYPTSGGLTTNSSPNVLADASSEIRKLSASGPTNMGDAIKKAGDLLAPESNPRGEVLLSDGTYNTGPDPLDNLPSGIPIYTIALGNHGQLDLLREISRRTGGQYLFTPDATGLTSIYYDMLEKGGVGQIVTNALQNVTPAQPMRNVVKLPAGLASASIGVNWAQPGFAWTTNYPPAAGQITTRVLDPNFNPYTVAPVYRQYGFVVFTLTNPMGGNWYFDTYFGGPDKANVTVGALDPAQTTTVRLEAPAGAVRAGETVVIHGAPRHDAEAAKGSSAMATVELPSVTEQDAIRTYGAALRDVALPQDLSDQSNADLVRLTLLRQRMLPSVEILPRHRVIANVAQSANGEFEIAVPTHLPGEYMVRIETTGPHPNGGEYMRTSLVCISAR